MTYTGTVYKYNSTYGFIEPDDRKGPRKDILFYKNTLPTKIGDRVRYSWVEAAGRRYVEEMEIIDKNNRIYG